MEQKYITLILLKIKKKGTFPVSFDHEHHKCDPQTNNI